MKSIRMKIIWIELSRNIEKLIDSKSFFSNVIIIIIDASTGNLFKLHKMINCYIHWSTSWWWYFMYVSHSSPSKCQLLFWWFSKYLCEQRAINEYTLSHPSTANKTVTDDDVKTTALTCWRWWTIATALGVLKWEIHCCAG